MPTSDDRQLKQAYLHKLYDEWANTDRRSSHSLIEFFLDNGVDVEVPPDRPGENGQTGTAFVQIDKMTTHECRGIWMGDNPEHMWFYYASIENAVRGTALAEQVSGFKPDVILTKETVLTLLNRLSSPAYDYVNDRARAYSIVRNWAHEQGIDV